MYTGFIMPPLKLLETIEQQATELVWYSPDQVSKGIHLLNDPKQGERPWIIPRTTGEFIYKTIRENNARTVLELGTSIGYSALWIASALVPVSGTLATLEKNTEKITIAKNNLESLSDRVTINFHTGLIDETLATACNELGSIDIVFLDADRGHYHRYFEKIIPYLHEQSIIIADNAINMQTRMKPFLELLELKGWKYEIIDIDNGILIATK